jgi:hypothetical protein
MTKVTSVRRLVHQVDIFFYLSNYNPLDWLCSTILIIFLLIASDFYNRSERYLSLFYALIHWL